MWKSIASIIGGAIVGFVVGAFVEKTVCNKKKEKEINELEEAFREELKERSRKACNKPDISEFKKHDEQIKDEKNLNDISEKVVEAKTNEVIDDMVKKYIEEGVATVKPKTNDIRVINEDEFYESVDFVRQTLTYYADGYLVTDRNKVISKPENLIGKTAVSILDSGEKSIVYVKNENDSTSFEIYYDSNYWLDIDGDDSDVGDFADELDE